eukprot:12194495-Alexandrium_andersonii.AAC.1
MCPPGVGQCRRAWGGAMRHCRAGCCRKGRRLCRDRQRPGHHTPLALAVQAAWPWSACPRGQKGSLPYKAARSEWCHTLHDASPDLHVGWKPSGAAFVGRR